MRSILFQPASMLTVLALSISSVGCGSKATDSNGGGASAGSSEDLSLLNSPSEIGSDTPPSSGSKTSDFILCDIERSKKDPRRFFGNTRGINGDPYYWYAGSRIRLMPGYSKLAGSSKNSCVQIRSEKNTGKTYISKRTLKAETGAQDKDASSSLSSSNIDACQLSSSLPHKIDEEVTAIRAGETIVLPGGESTDRFIAVRHFGYDFGPEVRSFPEGYCQLIADRYTRENNGGRNPQPSELPSCSTLSDAKEKIMSGIEQNNAECVRSGLKATDANFYGNYQYGFWERATEVSQEIAPRGDDLKSGRVFESGNVSISPIRLATVLRRSEIVEILTNEGKANTTEGLYVAIRHKDTATFEKLLSTKKLNDYDYFQYAHRAIEDGFAGAFPIFNKYGYSINRAFAYSHNPRSKSCPYVDCSDGFGVTLLGEAVYHGKAEVVDTLLNLGADPNAEKLEEVVDSWGRRASGFRGVWRPLQLVNGYDDGTPRGQVVEALLRAGATPRFEDLKDFIAVRLDAQVVCNLVAKWPEILREDERHSSHNIMWLALDAIGSGSLEIFECIAQNSKVEPDAAMIDWMYSSVARGWFGRSLDRSLPQAEQVAIAEQGVIKGFVLLNKYYPGALPGDGGYTFENLIERNMCEAAQHFLSSPGLIITKLPVLSESNSGNCRSQQRLAADVVGETDVRQARRQAQRAKERENLIREQAEREAKEREAKEREAKELEAKEKAVTPPSEAPPVPVKVDSQPKEQPPVKKLPVKKKKVQIRNQAPKGH